MVSSSSSASRSPLIRPASICKHAPTRNNVPSPSQHHHDAFESASECLSLSLSLHCTPGSWSESAGFGASCEMVLFKLANKTRHV